MVRSGSPRSNCFEHTEYLWRTLYVGRNLLWTREIRDDFTGSGSWQTRDYREVLTTGMRWKSTTHPFVQRPSKGVSLGLVRHVRAWALDKQGTAFHAQCQTRGFVNLTAVRSHCKIT